MSSDHHYKPKSKKIPDDLDARSALNIDDPNVVIPDDPRLMNLIIQRRANEENNKRLAKKEAEREEEDKRKMAEREKREEQDRKQRDEHYKNLPENQLNMLLLGTHYECGIHDMPMVSVDVCRLKNCTSTIARDIEYGRTQLAKEYRMHKIIRLSDEDHKTLMETGKLTLTLS